MKKLRHNPDKPQNNYSTHCSYDDGNCCEAYMSKEVLKKCKGDRHNCIKVRAQRNAICKNKEVIK